MTLSEVDQLWEGAILGNRHRNLIDAVLTILHP